MREAQLSAGKRSLAALSLKMVMEGDRLTLRPPRMGLAALLGVLTGVSIFAYGLLGVLHPSLPRTWEPKRPPIGQSGIHRTPPVTSEQDHEKAVPEPWYLSLLKQPWAAVLIGMGVYFVSKQVFRVRIVLDRGQNLLLRDGRILCPLKEVLYVEIDDTPRVQVMNEMALGLTNNRRVSLLLYNGSADEGLHRAAERIAEFAGIPLNVKKAYSFFRGPRKKKP